MYVREDLTGQKFGRWTVLNYDHTDRSRSAYWMCKCECGNTKVVKSASLRAGRSKSCGCLHREISREIGLKTNKTHGQFGTPLYFVWNTMKQRCNNTNSTSYAGYGGRGIIVCNEWKDFIPFHKWAIGNGYHEGLSIDRKDNDGPYAPWNCRWVTNKTQCRNRRSTTRFLHDGKDLTLPEWEEEIGIKQQTLSSRIYTYGWNIEKALATIVNKKI